MESEERNYKTVPFLGLESFGSDLFQGSDFDHRPHVLCFGLISILQFYLMFLPCAHLARLPWYGTLHLQGNARERIFASGNQHYASFPRVN